MSEKRAAGTGGHEGERPPCGSSCGSAALFNAILAEAAHERGRKLTGLLQRSALCVERIEQN